MSLFCKKEEKSVFLKNYIEDQNIEIIKKYLEENKSKFLEEELIKLINKDKKDKVVNFELLNTYLNMTCFHDIRILFNNIEITFDFLVITDKFICSIHCLDTESNYEINEIGNLIVDGDVLYNPFLNSKKNTNLLKNYMSNFKFINNIEFKNIIVTTDDEISLINSKYDSVEIELINSCSLSNELSKFNNTKSKGLKVRELEDVCEFILESNKELCIEYKLEEDVSLMESTLENARETLSSTFNSIRNFTKKSTDKIVKFTNDNIDNIFYTDEKLRKELFAFEQEKKIILPIDIIVKEKSIDDVFFTQFNLVEYKHQLIDIIERYV